MSSKKSQAEQVLSTIATPVEIKPTQYQEANDEGDDIVMTALSKLIIEYENLKKEIDEIKARVGLFGFDK